MTRPPADYCVLQTIVCCKNRHSTDARQDNRSHFRDALLPSRALTRGSSDFDFGHIFARWQISRNDLDRFRCISWLPQVTLVTIRPKLARRSFTGGGCCRCEVLWQMHVVLVRSLRQVTGCHVVAGSDGWSHSHTQHARSAVRKIFLPQQLPLLYRHSEASRSWAMVSCDRVRYEQIATREQGGCPPQAKSVVAIKGLNHYAPRAPRKRHRCCWLGSVMRTADPSRRADSSFHTGVGTGD